MGGQIYSSSKLSGIRFGTIILSGLIFRISPPQRDTTWRLPAEYQRTHETRETVSNQEAGPSPSCPSAC